MRKKNPAIIAGFMRAKKMSGDALLLRGQNRTTIGDEMFHVPVRNGKGWFHFSMTAGQTVELAIYR